MTEISKPSPLDRLSVHPEHAPISVVGRSSSGTTPAPACTLVIFGAGGDLTKRLLMPALYNLSGSHLLDDRMQVIGIDRNAGADEDWRKALTETLQSFTKDATGEFHVKRIDPEAWGWVRQRLAYLKGDFETDALFETLAHRLTGNVVFYLAVPARFFGPIVDRLGQAGLLKETPGAFRHVVIEKPFGRDLTTARALNQRILKQAGEKQFYRIDHFLGKETVQSLMAVRFANTIYEPIWRHDYIDHVQITAAETIGIEARGAFYEATGALRDMVPNHLFQLLCMTAMEAPRSFDAEAVRSEKAKLVEAVRPVGPADAVRGQYGAGSMAGTPARGYCEEAHVAKDSRTETFVALKLMIDNARWTGVPFYLRTGKRLAARRTEIAIQFKPAATPLFRNVSAPALAPNVIRLEIDPAHGIETAFNAKVPGPQMRLGRVATTFRYGDYFSERPNVGYETLLYDCMIGDATLFQRADNIEAGWSAIEGVLDSWSTGAPAPYAAGTAGPAAADELMRRDGRSWLPLDAA